MAEYNELFSYAETEGFEIVRGEKRYWTYGYCEGEYHIAYDRGDAWTPPDYEASRKTFSCWCEYICDDKAEEVDIILTEQEHEAFEEYMKQKLDEVQNEQTKC